MLVSCSPPFSPGDRWETGRPPSVFGQLGDWLPAGFVEVGDSIMLHDRVSSSAPVPQCQCATEPAHRAYGFVCNSACVFTVCMVRQALKRAMHDQILSHLHPDLLVSHLGLRSWETWAVCLPLTWCARRGPGTGGRLGGSTGERGATWAVIGPQTTPKSRPEPRLWSRFG